MEQVADTDVERGSGGRRGAQSSVDAAGGVDAEAGQRDLHLPAFGSADPFEDYSDRPGGDEPGRGAGDFDAVGASAGAVDQDGPGRRLRGDAGAVHGPARAG